MEGRFSPPFRIRVLLSTETEEQKKRGRPGNEASGEVVELLLIFITELGRAGLSAVDRL